MKVTTIRDRIWPHNDGVMASLKGRGVSLWSIASLLAGATVLHRRSIIKQILTFSVICKIPAPTYTQGSDGKTVGKTESWL